jgi:hypothetical protein
MKPYKRTYFNTVFVKLIIYIGIATITSLSNDLSHYMCDKDGFSEITPIHWCIIVFNLLVQGLIAWRAFLDGSAEKYSEYESGGN